VLAADDFVLPIVYCVNVIDLKWLTENGIVKE
jgi:hypothetical protein